MIVVFGALFLYGPIFTILALNCLFDLGLLITWKTWLSVAWLCMIFGGGKVAAAVRDRR